jgi:chromosome segregation ATPase
MGITIEISDKELMELLGSKDVEIAMNEKTIEAYKAQFEKVKALAIEMESLKKTKAELETSNKSLSDTNIKLDQSLTQARKERDTFKTEIEAKRLELARKISELDTIKLDLSKKTSEIQTIKSNLAGKTSEWESQVIELNTSKNELETLKSKITELEIPKKRKIKK